MSIFKLPINEVAKDSKQSISVCMEFETLFDIPFGIIKTVREFYYDPAVFNYYWMHVDNYTLRTFLYERRYYNPLFTASVGMEFEDAEQLLKEMYEDNDVYKKILDRSPKIAMFEFAERITQSTDHLLNLTIICKNKIQQAIINKSFKNITTRVVPNFGIDLNDYDLIILERYDNMLKYSNIYRVENKAIWMPEFAYNMDKDKPDEPNLGISVFVTDVNKVSTYEPYNNFIKPVG